MITNRRQVLQSGLFGALASLLPAQAQTPKANETQKSRIRGIIFMVSDGMSSGVIPLAEHFSHLTRKKSTAWHDLLSHPNASHGLMDTASANSLVTDSAAASSAWGCGHRVPNGHINTDAAGKILEPLAVTLAGKAKIGLVTTATVTHATPAGFAANAQDRGEESKIAEQYLNRVDVILGGGSSSFSPEKRRDKRDLFADFANAGYGIARTKADLHSQKSDKLLGVFYPSHLPFTIDTPHLEEGPQIPSLAEMSSAALDRFLPSSSPFLLQIEGARIDHAAHENDAAALLHDQIAFDDALALVLKRIATHDDVLLVVTSDHGNANPGLNGVGNTYQRSNDCFQKITQFRCSFYHLIQKFAKLKGDESTYQKLVKEEFGLDLTPEEVTAILNSYQGKPVNEWNQLLDFPGGILGQIVGNHIGIYWTSGVHTSDHTIITAIGPGSEQFSGLIRNDAINQIIRSSLLSS